MKVDTLIACRQRAFDSFGGVVKKVLYDNMKIMVLARAQSLRRRTALLPRVSASLALLILRATGELAQGRRAHCLTCAPT